ncbi:MULTISPECIES: HPF/RaiA family ribosome-associated protein [Halomonadaceae]|uniref:HPF/RaiA family ribosome-associated protein n=1 Tax=Halomonadaceae TaxID=28256 RepID=UPI001582EFE4|nr:MULTISPECIES: HPF/RaiA family ribosome-associated protein [Halomonas]MDI4639143.1 HPF/RaiA family ribosome-associated protein [Halomonas sp. BMC7]NUJ60135.1 hypothetical protein [Halomonas taeanensis]
MERQDVFKRWPDIFKRLIGTLGVAGVLLAGCASGPPRLPDHSDPAAAACQWTAPEAGSLRYLRRVIAALEADDFVIVESEVRLGLVTAQRSRILAGYGMPGYQPLFGLSGFFGLGGHRSTGMAISLNRSFGDDPTQVERVSVLARDTQVSLTRDLQIVEADGRLRSGRVVASEEFCRTLHEAIDRLSDLQPLGLQSPGLTQEERAL